MSYDTIYENIKEYFKSHVDNTVLCPFCDNKSLVKNETAISSIPTYWCVDCGFSTMLPLENKEDTMRMCIIYYQTLSYDVRKTKELLDEKQNRLSKAKKEVVAKVVADEL